LDSTSVNHYFYQKSLSGSPIIKDSAIGNSELNAWYYIRKDFIQKQWEGMFSTKGLFDLQRSKLPAIIKEEPPSLLEEETEEVDVGTGNDYSFGNYNLSQEEKELVAVLYAEAGISGSLEWKTITHLIMNRLDNPQDVWNNAKSVTDIVTKKSQFNGYGDYNYKDAMTYLNSRDGSNSKLEDMIEAILPAYHREEQDFTDGSMWYYSPRSMNPPGSAPNWASKLTEVTIPGINTNDYRFFKP